MKHYVSKAVGLVLAVLVLMAGGYYWHIHHKSTGKVLNIYCWDNSFEQLLSKYYPAYNSEKKCIGDVQVHWIIVPSTDNIYQTTLDKALAEREEVPADARIDMFLTEADYVRKYTGTAETSKSMSELGITEDELQEQFPYTREVATDEQGEQRGISWQACPGVMIYRRDIARRVFGTDDPAAIQQHVSDWEQFEHASDQLLAAGYPMVAGYFDTYRVFASNRSSAWVNDQQEIQLDPALRAWRAQMKHFTQQGKNGACNLWEKGWSAQIRGNTFCFFGPAWMINYALKPMSLDVPVSAGGVEQPGNGTFGEWAVCEGPQPFFWGGSWICAARDTDNAALIADIMRTLCCSEETTMKMARENVEFLNNRTVMERMAHDPEFSMPFLGGQNAYSIMYSVANKLLLDNQLTPYDQGMNETFQSAAREYFDGQISEEASWQKFLATAWLKYPELQSASFVR
jgi:hypothetical protein